MVDKAYDHIKEYPMVQFKGAYAYKVTESIYVIERGEILDIDGTTYFCFGGGFSVDAAWRTPGKSWWENELPTVSECAYGLNKLVMEMLFITLRLSR